MPLSAVSWTQDRSAPLTVAIYQPNIPLEKKWDRRYFRAIQQQYTDNSRPYFKNTDLVLWPESALPTYRDRIEDYLRPDIYGGNGNRHHVDYRHPHP